MHVYVYVGMGMGMCMCMLSGQSKSREHIKCLDHRLQLWREGDITTLLEEGLTIQQHLKHSCHIASADSSWVFAHLIFHGKIKATMRFLTEQSRGSFLPLSTPVGESTVFDELIRKHPDPSPITPTSLVTSNTTSFQGCHPIIFDYLNGDLICRTAVRVEGSAGPSGVDALGWRRLCTSFQTASSDLCHSLASVARRISTAFVDPDTLQPLLNYHLIALDKNPGVRPIGIGETSRHIIVKAVLQVVKQNVLDAAGCLQLCAGQRAGCEAAVHAMREIFTDKGTEGVLLVNASNTSNSLNCRAALLSIFQLCPPLATILTNTYRSASHLFIDGTSLLSREGTTQGDPLAMPMYTISVVSVIRQLMGKSGMLMMLLLGVVYSSSRIGGLGCFYSVATLVIMSTLLRPGWLSRKNIWLQLSASLMVQAFRLHLLGGLIWVQPSVPKTISEITHKIMFLNGLKVCLSYPQLLLLNLMLHMRFLHMGSPRNGNTFYELIHTLVISCPPLSLKFVNSFCLL